MARGSAGSFILLIVGLSFLLAGGGIGFFVGKPILDKAKASESWPSVEGEVLESRLESSRSKGKTSYSALVVYRYSVEGEEFEGDRVWFGQYSTNKRSEMHKIVKEYPAGKAVTVYFSPDDASEAVLQPGAFTSSYMVYSIGLLAFGVGCLLVLGPLVKLLFFASTAVTGSTDSFGDDMPGGSSFLSDGFDRQDEDEDAFPGIPGS